MSYTGPLAEKKETPLSNEVVGSENAYSLELKIKESYQPSCSLSFASSGLRGRLQCIRPILARKRGSIGRKKIFKLLGPNLILVSDEEPL